ncbi:MAG: hypothetical protein D8M26_05785 [Ignavibacteriae bacterium]|nr:MAG: hypothetical protein EDM72_02100 [Chlorobiota bacterium]MBL1122382.1 hypothetical protein [Ignavibacteriota bacterium]MCE7855016.1 hypothetical protein [Ignavibacteria bacterium CHB3]GIK59919.1 MAG: hypothetical protein BroJett017_08090 [Ignavibacteriota bacterium]GJQ42003.1 MAG: hypothetical protein JETCAE03_15010 [Ignavibacteriaceae bacterium]
MKDIRLELLRVSSKNISIVKNRLIFSTIIIKVKLNATGIFPKRKVYVCSIRIGLVINWNYICQNILNY